MDKVFTNHIDRNLEEYVDDMAIKSSSPDEHIQDLEEIFAQIQKYDMRMNPNRCVFDVQGRKFLGFMLTHRGIKANPNKCNTIVQIKSPHNIKELLALPPILTRLIDDRDLFLFLTVLKHSIGAIIIQEEGKSQNSIYCISKTLQGVDTQYQMIEKLVLTLVTSARWLHPYFHTHTVVILTDHPIR
ncbi:Retrovirus-related Pol polyprotein from transposon 17.6, partial [Mucuna pruriens]